MTIITKGMRTTDALHPSAWLGPAVLAGGSLVLLLIGTPALDLLRYQRAAVDAGQWWRLLSCNFVHLGFWHWLFNALSLVLLVALCPEPLSARAWIGRTLVLSLGVGAGIHWWSPQLATYVGLSGMIYGLFLLGLGRQALHGDKIAWACLVFLAGRVAWEFLVGAPASEERLLGGKVVPQSHLFGMLAAMAYAAACAAIAVLRGKAGAGARHSGKAAQGKTEQGKTEQD